MLMSSRDYPGIDMTGHLNRKHIGLDIQKLDLTERIGFSCLIEI